MGCAELEMNQINDSTEPEKINQENIQDQANILINTRA